MLLLLLAGVCGIWRVRLGGATAGCLTAIGVGASATAELPIALLHVTVPFVVLHDGVELDVAVTAWLLREELTM